MADRPIIFNDEMVRAILDGRKTQTRRPVKYSPVLGDTEDWCLRVGDAEFDRLIGGVARHCPYGQPGDRLWVRECWASADGFYGRDCNPPETVAYRADRSAIQFSAEPHRKIPDWDIEQWNWDKVRWRPSIHMPKWAARILLEVTNVRVERIQDISEADAISEGVNRFPLEQPDAFDDPPTAVELFRDLWDQIYEKRGLGWLANPWVWVIEFRRLP